MDNAVRVKCIKHIYPDKTEVNLCGLDFIVKKGEIVVMLASNGAGKTTLINHILGFLKPVDGEVDVLGYSPNKNFDKVRQKIGVVFQNVDEQIIGPRVVDDIGFTLKNNGEDKEIIKKKVEKLSKELGIYSLLDKIPHYLSGGQKKKVALAGALIHEPELIILDEPFEALDPKSKRDMLDILKDINKNNDTTIILTTHDINIVPEIADTIYVIDNGSTVIKGSYDYVFENQDIIHASNLENPILIDLFLKLRKFNPKLKLPKDVEEAYKELEKILNKKVE